MHWEVCHVFVKWWKDFVFLFLFLLENIWSGYKHSMFTLYSLWHTAVRSNELLQSKLWSLWIRPLLTQHRQISPRGFSAGLSGFSPWEPSGKASDVWQVETLTSRVQELFQHNFVSLFVNFSVHVWESDTELKGKCNQNTRSAIPKVNAAFSLMYFLFWHQSQSLCALWMTMRAPNRHVRFKLSHNAELCG